MSRLGIRGSTLLLAFILLFTGTSAAQSQTVVNDGTLDASPTECTTPPDASTINGGIAAASAGGTVLVCPGTYAEEVNVTKALTLNGPYAGTTFDGTSTDRGGEAIIQPPASAGAAVHVSASNVTIDGFTLDGDPNDDGDPEVFFGLNNFDPSANSGNGSYLTVTDFTVRNNIVKAFQGYGIFVCNGTSRCTGSASQAENGLTTGGVVSNNRFDSIDGVSTSDGDPFDFAGRAVSMETDGLIETVTDNVMTTGTPATGQNQYGIQTGNHGQGGTDGSAPSGITSLTLTFARNTIEVDDVGIWVNSHPNSGPSVLVDANDVNGRRIGIRVQNIRSDAGVTVQDNTVVSRRVGIRALDLTTPSGNDYAFTGNTVTFPDGQEFDGGDSGTTEGDALGEQTVGLDMQSIDGPRGLVVEDNLMGNTSSPFNGPFYGYALTEVQTGDPTVVQQTVSGATVNGVMQGVFVNATVDPSTPVYAASNFGVDGLVMDNFTGTSPNDAVNFHAGVFVFTTDGSGSPANPATTTGTISDVVVRNTGIAGGTSAPPPGCSTNPSDCGGQSSAGLYFGDFGGNVLSQDVTVQNVSLESNDNRGISARGADATVTVQQSSLIGNGDDPFSAGGNFGFGVIAREGATVTVENSVIQNPASSTDRVDALQSTSGGPVLTVTDSRIERNGNGNLITGSAVTNASGNAWQNGSVITSAETLRSFLRGSQNDYSPFLNTATDADGATAGFQGDFSTLNLDSESFDAPAQTGTKLEEALAFTGATNLRLQDGVAPGSGQYSVPAGGVTVPGDLAVVNDEDAVDFTTGGGTVTLIDENGSRSELIVEPTASVETSPTFAVANRFGGTSGTGNDTDWRILTSPRASATGADLDDDLDFSTNSGSILYTWDDTAQSFVQEDNTTSSALPSGRAFFVYYFDDSTQPLPVTLDVEGPLDTGTSFPTSDAFGTASRDVTLAAQGSQGCHVLGVPYAQSFDLSNLTLGGSPIGSSGEFDGVVQAWDPTAGSDGEFVQITEASDNSDVIAPWQGFWVTRASSTSGNQETLTFESAGRTTGAPFIGRKTAQQQTGRLAVTLTLEDGKNGPVLSDSRTTLYLREGASTGEDAYDAIRIAPPSDEYAQVSFTGAGDVRRAQASLPYNLGDRIEIPLHVEAKNLSGSAVLSTANWTNVPGDWTVFLTDTQKDRSLALDPGRTYRFDLDGTSTTTATQSEATGSNLGGPQTGSVSSRFVVTVSPDGVLPVEFASIDARADGQAAELTWATASETSNAGFRVQRKTETGFETLAFVEGAGTSTETTRYRHRVSDLDYGTHVFRLEQVDQDGGTAVSKEVAVDVGLSGAYDVSDVAPNPVSNEGRIEVAVKQAQSVTVAAYDALGRRVATLHEGEMRGGTTHTVSLGAGQLSSGHYFVRVQGEDFQTTRRLVVVR